MENSINVELLEQIKKDVQSLAKSLEALQIPEFEKYYDQLVILKLKLEIKILENKS